MESYQKFAVVALLLAAATASRIEVSNAQTICKMPAEGLMACRPAVTPPNPNPPSPTCCFALSHADMKCLCSYKNSGWLPSLGIDPNLALQLPDKCRLPHPPHC